MTRGGADVVVAEELLDGADVVAVLEEVCGEGVAKRVAGRSLGDSASGDGERDGALQDAFVEVVTAALTGLGVEVGAGRREDPLPGPGAAGGGQLHGEGVGELDPAGAGGQSRYTVAHSALGAR